MDFKKEYRTLATSLRAAPTEKFVLEGTAASYNHLSKDLGGFREKIAPGAFTRSLQAPDSDVIFTFNHGMKTDTVYGRTSAGTLVLRDDSVNLTWPTLIIYFGPPHH
jgi:HK97 family phage prohead protease